MDWIKKLKGLFGFKIDLRNFITINNNHVHIINVPSESAPFKKIYGGNKGNKLVLNMGMLTAKQKRTVKNSLKASLISDNIQGLLRQDALELLQDIKTSKSLEKFAKIYGLLKDIMPGRVKFEGVKRSGRNMVFVHDTISFL